MLKDLGGVWKELIGVEMEANGVANSVCQAIGETKFFMVRSASDLADSDKYAAKTEAWRAYACDVAAAYLVGLIRKGPIPIA